MLGKTGGFPKGKISDDDEGELRLAIGDKDGNVIIDFGTPVTWIGMPPKEAKEFADRILSRVQNIQMREAINN